MKKNPRSLLLALCVSTVLGAASAQAAPTADAPVKPDTAKQPQVAKAPKPAKAAKVTPSPQGVTSPYARAVRREAEEAAAENAARPPTPGVAVPRSHGQNHLAAPARKPKK
jgi:hypothetical protein